MAGNACGSGSEGSKSPSKTLLNSVYIILYHKNVKKSTPQGVNLHKPTKTHFQESSPTAIRCIHRSWMIQCLIAVKSQLTVWIGTLIWKGGTSSDKIWTSQLEHQHRRHLYCISAQIGQSVVDFVFKWYCAHGLWDLNLFIFLMFSTHCMQSKLT